MKNTILSFLGTILLSISFAQENFEWDLVSDSIEIDKEELYSKTKLFIAETWKSADDVIQLDDKEGGQILIKGVSVQKVKHATALFEYTYSYNLTFKFKDGKCRVFLKNVQCELAHYSYNEVVKIEPFEGGDCPKTSSAGVGISKKKAIIMMESLKQELQAIVDEYLSQMNNDNSTDDW